jgi:hypothetical protein
MRQPVGRIRPVASWLQQEFKRLIEALLHRDRAAAALCDRQNRIEPLTDIVRRDSPLAAPSALCCRPMQGEGRNEE